MALGVGLRYGALALAALLLSACGFQLQGRVPLPQALAVTWIDTDDTQSDFVVDLKRGEKIFVGLAVAEILVLLVAASGIVGGGAH